VWSAHEYDKLPAYDGGIGEQLLRGAHAMFFCHQQDGKLCAGWVGAHGARNLFAMRLHHDKVEPSAFDYESPVPLFKSGAAAAKHGKRALKRPGVRARRTIEQLLRKRGGKNG
jgi:hypothetical protein